jgi:hypothetical protein
MLLFQAAGIVASRVIDISIVQMIIAMNNTFAVKIVKKYLKAFARKSAGNMLTQILKVMQEGDLKLRLKLIENIIKYIRNQ